MNERIDKMNNNGYNYVIDIYDFISDYIEVLESLSNSNTKIEIRKNLYSYELIYKNIDIYFYDDYYNVYVDKNLEDKIEINKLTDLLNTFKVKLDENNLMLTYSAIENDYSTIEKLKLVITEVL